jgi:hypothetical protein
VIESGRCARLKGKTPEAAVAAILAVGSKPGGPFKRVDKATYTLADVDAGPNKKNAQPEKRQRATSSKRRHANASA